MVVSWTNFTSAGAIRDVSVTAVAMRIVMANFGCDKLTALRAPIIVRRILSKRMHRRNYWTTRH